MEKQDSWISRPLILILVLMILGAGFLIGYGTGSSHQAAPAALYKCPNCGQDFPVERRTVITTLDGKFVELKAVPDFYCMGCGKQIPNAVMQHYGYRIF